jgi:hypothetical protein
MVEGDRIAEKAGTNSRHGDDLAIRRRELGANLGL